MPQSEYDLGYEDGKNGNPRKERDTLTEILLGHPVADMLSEDFDYEEYNRGYDDGEAAQED